MDDRKRQINELEQRKREQVISLDLLLARFGEILFGRAGDVSPDDAAFEELVTFRRLKNDIADSEAAIQTVEEQIRRFRELEENIDAKEQEDSAGLKELAIVYGRLGKLLLDLPPNSAALTVASVSASGGDTVGAGYSGGVVAGAGAYGDFCAPYRDQADALRTKVLSLDERLTGLEEKEGGNVFTWIGKNAQGLVLRSFLTKAQENLEQLHRTVGERYSRRDTAKLIAGETDNGGSFEDNNLIEELCADIERRRAETRTLMQELSELKEERKEISGSFDAEGGPLKQIQTLKNHIAMVRDELKSLYRRLGAEAAAVDGAERREVVNSLIRQEDQETLDTAAGTSRSIRDNEKAIEKLQASLAIDEEKEKIEKSRRMIQEKRDKIAQAEKSIAEYEENIRVSEASIEKLQSLL